jgi:hypothetical protein
MQDTIQISTHHLNGLYDITEKVKALVSKSGIQNGMVSVYVQGATAAIMIQLYMIVPLLANVWEWAKSKLSFFFLIGIPRSIRSILFALSFLGNPVIVHESSGNPRIQRV